MGDLGESDPEPNDGSTGEARVRILRVEGLARHAISRLGHSPST
jgi:hypothetical protein